MCCYWCGDIVILEMLNFNLNGLYKWKILSTFVTVCMVHKTML